MFEGLDAIYDELRRLQKEGVGHIYIDDETKDLLKPALLETKHRKRGKPVEHANLAELLKKPQPVEKTVNKPVKEISIEPLPAPPTLEVPEADKADQLNWLKKSLLACPTCNERKGASEQLVTGDGSPDADILFCGDAPGTDEAMEGKPFIGNAGQLLDKIIKAMGLSREQVYCTNIMKWRPNNNKPYGNRPPNEDEMTFCLPYFRAELEIIQPKVIIALGNHAVTGLLGHDPKVKFGSIRGTWQTFQDIDVMLTFHPSYLLRNDTLKTKRMLWEDLLAAMAKVELPISDKQKGFFLK
ncbi:MAG TPA: uracil-DNA glycosylase [Opitutae bacterium]|nr:uracil-DNA glycosylase [Opitutae bacterium]